MKTKDNTKNKKAAKKQNAFKDNVKMLIDATKNAFKAKSVVQSDARSPDDMHQKKKIAKSATEAQIAFFYTNDKYFIQSDDNEIIETIKEKYPNFMRAGQTDAELKTTIISILQDKEFIFEILEYYNLSLQDFFRFMFRLDTVIFKGPFLTKLQKIVYNCKYEI